MCEILNNVAYHLKYSPNILELKLKRNMLILVNPIGGKGKAMKIYKKLQPFLNMSDIEFSLIETKYYKHAYEYILNADLSTVKIIINIGSGIISLSGDGITHEVVNALMHRNDEFYKHIPIGVIPGGSGNGISATVCSLSNLQLDIHNCAYIIMKGQTIKMDLFEFELLNEPKSVYSFHSFTYGLIADVDFDSEM